MADIQVNTNINNPDVGKTINQFTALKQEIKAAKGELAGLQEGTDAFAAQAAKVGQLNDKLQNLNKNIASVSGAPIENLTGSFGNLSAKIQDLNFKDAGTALSQFSNEAKNLNFKTLTEGAKAFGSGLLDLGKVLLTSPIFLITAAVVGIGVALYELKDKVKVIGDAFDFFGNVLSGIVDGFKDLTDAIGLTSFAEDELAQQIKKNAQENYDSLQAAYSNALKLAKASGEDTTQLEKDKLNSIIKNNQAQLDDLRKTLHEKGALNEDEAKQFKKLAQDIADERTDLIALDLANEKKASDERKKLADQEAKDIEKIKEDSLKRIYDKAKEGDQLIAQGNKEVTDRETKEQQDALDAQIKIAEDFKNKNIEFDKDYAKTKFDEDQHLYQTIKSNREKDIEDNKKAELQKQKDTISIATEATAGLQGLSDLYFAIKDANLQKGSKAEDDAARKQFKINKALQLANAAIQGTQAVLAAYSSGAAIPVIGAIAGPAFAAIAAVVAGANIAKIAATEYQSPVDSSSAPATTTGSTRGSDIPIAAPNINSSQGPTQTGFTPTGTATNTQTNSNVPLVAVLETDIRRVTTKVNVLESRATFGV